MNLRIADIPGEIWHRRTHDLINTDRPIDPMLWRSMIEWNAASPLTGAPEHWDLDDLWYVMSLVLMVLGASSCHRFWIAWYCDTRFMRRPMPNLTQPIYGAPIVSRETRNEATGFKWSISVTSSKAGCAATFCQVLPTCTILQRFWYCPTKMEACAKSCWPMA